MPVSRSRRAFDADVPIGPDRRLCRPPDCADLDTACVSQREIPTRDIGTILSGCPGSVLPVGAIPRAGLLAATRSSATVLE